MARYGYLCCKECREYIFLGKWLRSEDDRGFGFWHGSLSPEVRDGLLLGRKALRFVARHMDHDLLAMSDEGGRADSIWDTNQYVKADDVYDEVAAAPEPVSWSDPERE